MRIDSMKLAAKAENTRPIFLLSGFIILVFVCIAYFSISRFLAFNAEFLDLGLMSQTMWSGAQGQPMVYTNIYGPVSGLTKHAEFFFYLFTPIYRLCPSPVTLLVLQAGLFVAGSVPVFRLANRRLNHAGSAFWLSVSYLLYPVAITALLFDFHGDTLAMPLILFAIEALDRCSPKEYLLWLALALSCKVYVAAPIIALGGVLWIQKRHKYAYLTWAVAFIWIGFILFARAYLLPKDLMLREGETAASYFNFYFSNINLLRETLALRVLGAFVAVMPALVLGIIAPLWMAPGLMVAGAVFISTGPFVYKYASHHYALAVPFLLASMIFGAEKERKGLGNKIIKKYYGSRSWKKDIVFSGILVGIFSLFFVPTPQSLLARMVWGENSLYSVTSRDGFVKSWLQENVPQEAALLVDSYLAPHLANRRVLYSNYYADGPGYLDGNQLTEVLNEVDCVVLDTYSVYARMNPITIREALISPDLHLIKARNGLLLFDRSSPGLEQKISTNQYIDTGAAQIQFGDLIGLVNFDLEDLGDRLYKFRYDWVASGPLDPDLKLMAVTRIEGLDNSRIVHLPTLALLPPSRWENGMVVREEFEYEIPEQVESGRYGLWLGWYYRDRLLPDSYDPQSRLGEEVQIGFLDVR
jgi:uncharacterized membrane protein